MVQMFIYVPASRAAVQLWECHPAAASRIYCVAAGRGSTGTLLPIRHTVTHASAAAVHCCPTCGPVNVHTFKPMLAALHVCGMYLCTVRALTPSKLCDWALLLLTVLCLRVTCVYVCARPQGIISHMGSNTACGHYVAHVKKVRGLSVMFSKAIKLQLRGWVGLASV